MVEISSPSFSVDEIKGILFKDLKDLIKSKEDLENIIFSTKVIFESKSDLMEFFDLLINYGYKEHALNYFEELTSKIDDYDLINSFNELLK
jgi:hypothetical protein